VFFFFFCELIFAIFFFGLEDILNLLL